MRRWYSFRSAGGGYGLKGLQERHKVLNFLRRQPDRSTSFQALPTGEFGTSDNPAAPNVKSTLLPAPKSDRIVWTTHRCKERLLCELVSCWYVELLR